MSNEPIIEQKNTFTAVGLEILPLLNAINALIMTKVEIARQTLATSRRIS